MKADGKISSKFVEHGDLRLVILHFLADKPRHGYEIIKAIDELSKGTYTPSPGSIYPTLTFLEESGFADSVNDQKKKLFSITPEGKKLLKKEAPTIEMILSRIEIMGEKMSRLREWIGRDNIDEAAKDSRPSIRRSVHRLKSELFSFTDASGEVKRQIVKIIDNAIDEIKKLKE